MKKVIIFAAAAVAVAVPAIAAPNPNGAPISGQVTLSAGFANDPRVVNVRAGGTNNANSIAGSCAGFISDNPDYRVHYSSGSLPLIISVAARTDTTLVINGPDGRWYCDDDSGNGSNPSVRFNSPASGRYEIWVGTYSSGATQPGRLHISEVTSQ
ncbi:MAG TPA: hypothetical protein VGB54_10005 [Allosphingosinicella sp.]